MADLDQQIPIAPICPCDRYFIRAFISRVLAKHRSATASGITTNLSIDFDMIWGKLNGEM
jgi:hypothetical protein